MSSPEQHERLVQQIAAQGQSLSDIDRRLNNLEQQIGQLMTQVNRWKGGFLVLSALGAFAGWLIVSWGNVKVTLRGMFG